ncbi:MAG: hypothetical protein ACI9T7_000760 [Oleiphilaceae bacterium]|jgi:hypothetical protein
MSRFIILDLHLILKLTKKNASFKFEQAKK